MISFSHPPERNSLSTILENVPIVNYVDFHTTKQAMFKLIETNDHVVSFTKKIKSNTSQMTFRRANDMVYFEMPITDYASTDFISDIDSNALEMYLCYISSLDQGTKTKVYMPIDTVITTALYKSTVPSLVFGFDKLFVPECIYITMTMNLVPMNVFNKIKDDVATKTSYYNEGKIYLNDDFVIQELEFE